jgi:pyrroline-5-carboxylate reductase
MASAILDGAADAGVVSPDRVIVAEPDPVRRGAFALGAASASEALDALTELEAVRGEGAVLLAVKPQVFAVVAAEVRDRFAAPHPGRLVVSILAGVTTGSIQAALGPAARVVRVMPNTPAQVRRGVSAVAGDGTATRADLERTRALFGAVGQVVDLPEDLIDAFTGVAGSGPAYAFLLAEAMADAGVRVGLDRETSAAIARATVAGAGALLDADDRPADELRRAVTSKGGTTAAAIEAFETGGLRELVARAVEAARDRGREMGRDG